MQLENLPGAEIVIGWFGYMPSFHEAEVIEINLRRMEDSTLAVYCWHTTNELDANGLFLTSKHAVVTFTLTAVSDVDLRGFNEQNVISGMELEQVDNGMQLQLSASDGLAGTITAERIAVELQAGKPRGAVTASKPELS